MMNYSERSSCRSGSTPPPQDREPGADTCCGELTASTNAAPVDPAIRREREKCGSSRSSLSDEDLKGQLHSETHEGTSPYVHISSNTTSTRPTMTCCGGDTCCDRKLSGDLPHDVDMSNSSDSIEIKDIDLGEFIDIPKRDDQDTFSHKVRQITLSVSGMTCTSCLNSLDQCLNSIPTISNIKTNFLLSQAIFDLQETPSLDKHNIANFIATRTGFTCSLISHIGENLDLILESSVSGLGDKLPSGVVGITTTAKNKIRISYQPRIIGARELLSDPFFQYASLAPPPPPPLLVSGQASIRKSLFSTMLSAILTLPVLVFSYGHLPDHEVLYGGISCALASLVQFLVVGPFYKKAYVALFFSKRVEMDMLVILSTTTAYVYSVIAYSFLVVGRPLATGEFFETSTLLVTLVMVGRTIAEYARHKAVESISMESLQNPSAIIIEDGKEEEIDARLLQFEDIFKVLPETSIVTDGVILEGETEVDESMITGESTLIAKKPGMSVVAGSVNHSGTILVGLTSLPSENTIKTISNMVEEAKSLKPKVQEIAGRVAGYFVTGILGITPVVFIVWCAVGIAVRHQSSTTAAINAMTFAISTLIVSCPCAIGLAVPMVVLIVGGIGAKHGLIFKSTETIEIGRKISHVIFDKTGTLTKGKLSVVDEEYFDDSECVASAILGLITDSKHPVSTAVSRHLNGKGIKAVHVENILSFPGNGMEGVSKGVVIRAGNPYWLGMQGLPSVNRIISRALTTFCVTFNGRLVAVFGLQDELRPDAIETINELRKRSIDISLISGDNDPSVKALATYLGIPPQNTRSRCTPGEKQAYVKSTLLAPNSTVLFCGDGTNDAVALAQASIGLHINEGTDVAQSAADAILMRPSLKGILTLIDLSKAFWRRVVFNFVWSFVYNLFAILLAAGAFAGKARIPPQYAGLGELVSVLPVIGVAVALRWKKF